MQVRPRELWNHDDAPLVTVTNYDGFSNNITTVEFFSLTAQRSGSLLSNQTTRSYNLRMTANSSQPISLVCFAQSLLRFQLYHISARKCTRITEDACHLSTVSEWEEKSYRRFEDERRGRWDKASRAGVKGEKWQEILLAEYFIIIYKHLCRQIGDVELFRRRPFINHRCFTMYSLLGLDDRVAL